MAPSSPLNGASTIPRAVQSFRVLRFWNNDVLQRTDVVLEMIRAAVLEIPPPYPPHKGEGD
jgi:very-short-patch-repair endonuclease